MTHLLMNFFLQGLWENGRMFRQNEMEWLNKWLKQEINGMARGGAGIVVEE